MPRVILKYRSIAHGTMKSTYLEFNPPIHDVKGKSVRYECLNLEIYASPETCQQIKQNKAVEEVAETIRCERHLQLVRSDYSFLAKARLDEDFLEYFRENGDYTGLRRSDILALRWEDIHHDRGRKACLRFCIKKTGALVQLPLSLPAVRVLGEQQLKGKVFPMLTESILTTHVSRWVRKAKINKHITFHCFRHTFAMQLLDKGVDIYTITALLGHRQVSSTQNYAKITPKKVLEAIMKIG